jgi:phage shock protein PspC (stress-responsive transcriptional regulator)
MALRRYSKHEDKLIAGVCGGLSEYIGMDISLWRILFVFLIFTPVPIITIYLLGWLIIPKQ